MHIIVSFIALLFFTHGFANQPGLKNGEELYINYCSGCHSLNYTTFPRVSMSEVDAKKWFGIVPPDLTLVAKYRGANWVSEYLHSFYYDSTRPFNCNNKLIPNVQMPNVLYSLQNNKDYSQNVADIIKFLEYVADPYKEERYKLGIFVEIFLVILILGLFALSKISCQQN